MIWEISVKANKETQIAQHMNHEERRNRGFHGGWEDK
jgi:hypothetical protein